MKNKLNHLAQGIAGFVAFVFFMKLFENLDFLYLAGVVACIAIIVGLRMVPNSDNPSLIEVMSERDKRVTTLSVGSIGFIIACGIATPFAFGLSPARSELTFLIVFGLIGLLFGAMFVLIYNSIKFPPDHAGG